ncbi:MAG: hypothetical protein IT184_00825 [Acidobacteria bacterium]|nr:hypothetical protein [Acidobacteriota bacterium]
MRRFIAPHLLVLSAAGFLVACQSKTTEPSRTVVVGDTGGVSAALTAPAPDSPADRTQLSTLRPTLTVRNGTSTQAGARVYEFQVSDQASFASIAPASRYFAVVANATDVAEGTNGSTSFTPAQDLQPTTRFYWRARVRQGTAVSQWSETRTFNSKLVGYNRPGELYDPLIHGETVGERIGATTFVAGKGLRIENQQSYVRYALPQTIAAGEFSVEIEGLRPNGPGGKLKLFSMFNGTGDLLASKYLMNVQYRGVPGNPDNAISFKTLFGDEDYKLEPDFGTRAANVLIADPATAYYWKATWSNEFRLTVQRGGPTGSTFYNVGVVSPGGSYGPSPHYAYLGATDGNYGVEDGSWPGAIYRNVWIGNRPRPESLGSALLFP